MSDVILDLTPFGYTPGDSLHTECLGCGRAVQRRRECFANRGFTASMASTRCRECAEVAYREHALQVACGVIEGR
jgi:hypothetical protein